MYPSGTLIKTFTLKEAKKISSKIDQICKILVHPPTFIGGKKYNENKTIESGSIDSISLQNG